jgi:hypothetical protein
VTAKEGLGATGSVEEGGGGTLDGGRRGVAVNLRSAVVVAQRGRPVSLGRHREGAQGQCTVLARR